jgi:hypothetical protein
MRKVIFALLAALLLSGQTSVLPGFAPGTFQDTNALTVKSSGGSCTINSVSLSANTFNGPASSGTVIGTISSSTTGSCAANAFTLSGTNAASFQISGTSLETNGVVQAGSYSINIVNTIAGATGSPYTQAETITGNYFGPGDMTLAASTTDWYGIRAYNQAQAAATANIAIFQRSGDAYASSCTGISNIYGALDLTTTYCAGSTNLPTWCGASSGHCVVGTLYDQVGSNNATSTTNTQKPTLAFSCIGSLPCLQFIGINSTQLKATITSATYGNLIAVANRNPTSTSRMDVISKTNDLLSFYAATSEIGFYNLGTTLASGAASVTDAAWHVIAAMFPTTSATLYWDGTTGTGTVNVGTSGGTGFCIGGNATCASNYLTGYFVEGAWYAGTTGLTTANVNTYCTNASNYWGISSAC